MAFNKYLVNIVKMLITGEKQHMEFVADDVSTYKLISLAATLSLLIVRISILLLVTAIDCYNVQKPKQKEL